VIIVCGKREAEERTVNIRRLGSKHQTAMGLDEAVSSLVDEAIAPDLRRDAE
jgi:threonyl-tRNA synthetase